MKNAISLNRIKTSVCNYIQCSSNHKLHSPRSATSSTIEIALYTRDIKVFKIMYS